MGKGVEQFDHRLVVVAIGWGEQEAQDQASQTDHAVQLVAKVFHGLAAADAIVGAADKITGSFPPLVAYAGHRSRVNAAVSSNCKASSTSCKLRRTARITLHR